MTNLQTTNTNTDKKLSKKELARLAKEEQTRLSLELEQAHSNVQAVNVTTDKVKFDMFDKTVTKQYQATALMKSSTKEKAKEKSQTDNVRLTSFKKKNDIINRTFIVETAMNIASRTIDCVTCLQLVSFIEQVLQLKSFKYKRETSNVQRVRLHVQDTIKLQTASDCYSFDASSQTIHFSKAFLAENRKNTVHIASVDKDIQEIIEYAISVNHVIS